MEVPSRPSSFLGDGLSNDKSFLNGGKAFASQPHSHNAPVGQMHVLVFKETATSLLGVQHKIFNTPPEVWLFCTSQMDFHQFPFWSPVFKEKGVCHRLILRSHDLKKGTHDSFHVCIPKWILIPFCGFPVVKPTSIRTKSSCATGRAQARSQEVSPKARRRPAEGPT